jgi:hypothetical protein
MIWRMMMCTFYMSNYCLCDFLEVIDNEKIIGKWYDRWWCVYLACQEMCYNNLSYVRNMMWHMMMISLYISRELYLKTLSSSLCIVRSHATAKLYIYGTTHCVSLCPYILKYHTHSIARHLQAKLGTRTMWKTTSAALFVYVLLLIFCSSRRQVMCMCRIWYASLMITV